MVGLFFFYIIGIYAFLWWFIDNFKSFFQILWNVLMSHLQPDMYPELSERFGNWAVVTGSTDGIGKEYAKQLAQRGINIIFIARNESKLIDVSKEIESSYAVQTKYIVADFSYGREIYDRIKRQLQDLRISIGILVNNVGVMYDYPEEFAKVSDDNVWNLMMTNVAAMTMMTYIIVNEMKLRKKGVIVNVSSGCSLTPTPYGCLYAATKAFANSFTMALQRECAPYGIKVQLLAPFVVSTKMTNYSRAKNIFIPDVDSYCRWAIFTLGKTYNTSGYWSHAIEFAIFKTFPIAVREWFMVKKARHFHNEYLAQNNSLQCSADCLLCHNTKVHHEKTKPE